MEFVYVKGSVFCYYVSGRARRGNTRAGLAWRRRDVDQHGPAFLGATTLAESVAQFQGGFLSQDIRALPLGTAGKAEGEPRILSAASVVDRLVEGTLEVLFSDRD